MATHPHLIRARNALADGFQHDARQLAGPLVADDGTPFVVRLAQWLGRFFGLIEHGIGAAFRLGRGSAALTDGERGIVSHLVDVQHGFARNFAGDIRDAMDAGSPMSEAAVASRSALYGGGAIIHPFSAGQSERWNVRLDHYPGDGSTPCLGNCRCVLDFQDDGQIVQVTWRAVDDTKTCEVCQQRADEWNPLILTRRDPIAA